MVRKVPSVWLSAMGMAAGKSVGNCVATGHAAGLAPAVVVLGQSDSNPVVSDDGRYIAFQMARRGDPAGVGRGLFLLDIKAMEAARK